MKLAIYIAFKSLFFILIITCWYINTLAQVKYAKSIINQPVNVKEYPWRLSFENISYAHGLPKGEVKQVLIDKTGFCWISILAAGLVRYDGLEIKTYRNIPDNPASIPSNFSYFMYIDKDGVLWVATDAGLGKYNTAKDSFETFKYELSSIHHAFLCFFEDHKGNFWIMTSQLRFIVFNKKTGKFKPAVFAKGILNMLTGDKTYNSPMYMHLFKTDGHGKIWFITVLNELGICTFDPRTEEWQFYPLPSEIKEFSYQTLFPEKNNKVIWLSGWNTGLVKFNLQTLQWEHFFPEVEGQSGATAKEKSIIDIYPKSEDELFLCTQAGIRIFNTRQNTFYTLTHRPQEINSPLPGWFFNIYKDVSGNFWIGGKHGISKLDPYNQQFTYQKILPDHFYSTYIFKDKESKTIFFAAQNTNLSRHAIYSYNESTGKIMYREYPELSVKGIGLEFWFIEKDKTGRIWVGGEKGLFHLNQETLELSRVSLPLANNPDLNTSQIAFRMIAQSQNGDLWMATLDAGLIQFQIEKGIFYQFDSSKIISNTLRYVFADSQDNIWVGSVIHSAGINQINAKNNKIRFFKRNEKKYGSLRDANVYGFAEDKAGRIWIGTKSGLQFYDFESDKFSDVEQINAEVFYVATDKMGGIWMKTIDGLFRYLPSQKKLKVYGDKEGLILDFFSERMNVAWDGEIFLSDNYRFYPETIRDNPHPPITFFKSFKVFEKELKLNQDLHFIKEISLSYLQNFFTIEFNSISFTHSEKNTFAYQLDGIDKEWVYCGTRRSASYTRLPAGKYQFKVKAANNDGKWGKEITLQVTIIPAFWQTTWFLASLLSIIFLMAYYFYINQMQAIRNKAELKKKEEQFKRKIAEVKMMALRAQMNPHFLFNCLNSINNFTLANDSERASDYLTKFAQLIRLVLENSKSEKVSLSKELLAINLYIFMEQMRFQNKFTFQLIIDDSLETDEIKIPPLLLQPFIENSIWHGLMHKNEAGEIFVKIQPLHENILHISIEDNGIGRKKAMELKSKSFLKNKSFGMQITNDKIKLINELYKIQTQLEVSDLYDEAGKAAGARVELWIPY